MFDQFNFGRLLIYKNILHLEGGHWPYKQSVSCTSNWTYNKIDKLFSENFKMFINYLI